MENTLRPTKPKGVKAGNKSVNRRRRNKFTNSIPVERKNSLKPSPTTTTPQKPNKDDLGP